MKHTFTMHTNPFGALAAYSLDQSQVILYNNCADDPCYYVGSNAVLIPCVAPYTETCPEELEAIISQLGTPLWDIIYCECCCVVPVLESDKYCNRCADEIVAWLASKWEDIMVGEGLY